MPDTTLSPELRQAQGFYRVREVHPKPADGAGESAIPRVPRWHAVPRWQTGSILRALLTALVMIALGAIGGFLGGVVAESASPTATPPSQVTTTPATTPLEETIIDVPMRIPGDWPTSLGSFHRNAVSDRSGIKQPHGVIWYDETPGQFEASPVSSGSWIVIGNRDGRLYLYDKTDPEIVLIDASPTGSPIRQTVTAAELDPGEGGVRRYVFVQGIDGNLSAYDTVHGRFLWSRQLDAPASPIVVGNEVYVGASDGHIYVLNPFEAGHTERRLPATGEPPGPITTGLSLSGSGNVALFGRGAELHRLDLETGEIEACEVVPDTTTIMTPVIADGVAYVATANGMLFGYDDTTCQFITGYGLLGATLQPTIADGVIYQPVERGLLAVETERAGHDLVLLWGGEVAPTDLAPTERPVLSSSPVVTAHMIYFGAEDGRLYAVDRSDGTLAWSFRIGTDAVSTPLVLDGVVYAAAFDGTIRAISGTRGP